MLSIAYDSDNDLSEEAATDILSDFIAANNVSRSSMSTFSLTNKFTINEVNNATRSANKDHVTFYEYETENQREKKKALVCGDKRFPAVVAYIDSYNKTSILPADIMLANAKQYVLSTISQIKHYEDSLRVQTIDKVRRIKPFTGDFLSLKTFLNTTFLFTKIQQEDGLCTRSCCGWDTYWSVYGFLNLADSYQDPSVKPRIIEHAQGNIRNFFDHQLEDGYIPMMIEVADWPEPYLNMRHKEGKIMNMHKPFLCSQMCLISDYTGDYAWTEEFLSGVAKYFECYDHYYFHEKQRTVCMAG